MDSSQAKHEPEQVFQMFVMNNVSFSPWLTSKTYE